MQPRSEAVHPCFIHISESGLVGTPTRCYLTAAEAGVCGTLLLLPHCPGSADVLLGGRSDFSTLSVSQFILSIFSDLVTPNPCLLLNCSLGLRSSLRQKGTIPTEARSQSLLPAASPSPMAAGSQNLALRIRLRPVTAGAQAHP